MNTMGMPNPPTFEALLKTAGSKAPGSLKMTDIKRLLKAAGKRPTETQAEQIAEMLASAPENQALVYEILGDLVISDRSNHILAPLKPALWRVVESWLSSPPPADQKSESILAWLRSQCECPAHGGSVSDDRHRGVLLKLIELYRNPDTFLKCLREVGPTMGKPLKLVGKKLTPRRNSKIGFVMEDLARALYAAGKGGRPKFAKVVEIALTVDTVLTYLQEKEAIAADAIKKLGQLEEVLVEQRRINAEQAVSLQRLEGELAKLQTRLCSLTVEVSKWKQLHEEVVKHTNSAVAEGKKTLLTDLQSRIRPKLNDARLYANRPTPAVDQLLRLLGEVEKILENKEGQP